MKQNLSDEIFHREEIKRRYVRSMFDSIAWRYDFLNHLLSFGFDYLWRRYAVGKLSLKGGERILDVACGTGDFSLSAIRERPSQIFGVDVSVNMLKIFRTKAEKKNFKNLFLVCAEAERLPLKGEIFDICLVAFGVRNFSNLELGLAEIHRVLKQGGKLAVLEFSMPSFPFRPIYLFYFKYILPLVGKIFSKHESAYLYLPESVFRFPEGEDFAEVMREAGFSKVWFKKLTMGIVTFYLAEK